MILGTAVVLMGDLTTLEVGDVIRLIRAPVGSCPHIEDAEKFYGAPGVAGNRMPFRSREAYQTIRAIWI